MARNFGMSRKYSRNTDKFINGIFKFASAYAREVKKQEREKARQEAAYNRLIAKQEREEIRLAKQHEMALRREEREQKKAEREREEAARMQAKLERLKQFEDEITEIENINHLWTNVHGYITPIVTLDDAIDLIGRCDYEQQNNVNDGLFKKSKPDATITKQLVNDEAKKQYDYSIQIAQEAYLKAKKDWKDFVFDEIEPSIDSVADDLAAEAKETVSAFFPWKQSKLRKAYVDEHLDERFEELHAAWDSKKKEYESQKARLKAIVDVKEKEVNEKQQAKIDFVINRTNKLVEQNIKEWEHERDEFYDSLRMCTQNIIDGDRNYVISAICSIVQDEELPMKYFVDFVYEEEKGKVMVDLDLPEIEDIPDKMIITSSSGKKSIRSKRLLDLKSDYASCVFGLAMYVAHQIFNVSLKINEIEITGFTQRQGGHFAVPEDQYVFIVDFPRDLFASIDFERLSSYQIMTFFKHYFDMSKNCDLKKLDLSTAYTKMESFIPADYQTFIASQPPVIDKEETIETVEQSTECNSPKVQNDNIDYSSRTITKELTRDILENLIK